MDTISVISLFALLLIITVLALVIDNIQVKRHKKIKKNHSKALKKELDKSAIKSDKNKKQ